MLPLHPFLIHDHRLPTGTPTEEHPLTTPMTMLLCRYPLGHYIYNPNFMLIYSCPNTLDEYQDPLYACLTSGSQAPLNPTADDNTETFWMKTYSENAGLLEKLEEEGVLKRTGLEEKQGFVTLIAVETVLRRGQWAEVCSGCGRREQLSDAESGLKRMVRCSRCKESHYCNKECQTEDWENHKEACKVYRK